MSRRFLFILLFVLAACRSAEAAVLSYVDLSQRAPVPAAAEVVPLRVAVAAIISPQSTADSYSELVNYIGDQIGRPVELVQRRTYAEVNELIADQAVDVAFVCTSAYVDGSDSFGVELLVASEINGQSIYYSELIVAAHSDAQSLADLREATFAFTDPMSFSGRVYPSYLVQQLGETPEHFFGRTFFTYNHDHAIDAVAAGVADGAAVDSFVLSYALDRDPSLRDRLRVLHRSPPFGIPPVVTPPDLPPRQRVQLREILLNMDKDAGGRQILAHLGIDRFVSIDDRAYDSVRRLVELKGATP